MVDVWSGEPAAECGEAVSRLHVYSELLPHLQLMRCWVCLNQVNVNVGKSCCNNYFRGIRVNFMTIRKNLAKEMQNYVC